MRRSSAAFATLATVGYLTAGSLTLGLAGCAALTGPQAQQKQVVTACNGYADALATAAAYRAQGKLNTKQINTIDNVVKVAHPICKQANPPETQAALDQVETAVSQIQATNHKVK